MSIIKCITTLFLLKLSQISLQCVLHSSNFVVRLLYHLILLCVFRCPYDVVIFPVLFSLASGCYDAHRKEQTIIV
jgi:hypothetical protein